MFSIPSFTVLIRSHIILVIAGLCGPSIRSVSQSLIYDQTGTITQYYQISLSDKQFKNLINTQGQKLSFKDAGVQRNGQKLDVNTLKLRGNSSLNFRRKSLLLRLNHPISEGSTKKLSLTSLVMDKNYWRNRFCILLLDSLNLYPLYNEFASVVINDEPQGVYLAQQKVDDYIKRTIKSPLLVRRTGSSNFTEYISNGSEGKKQKKKLYSIRKLTRKITGKELYDSLQIHTDIDQYLLLLAFNSFVLNGDYTDEMYIYFDPEIEKFRIIPWDFDDVFAQNPHEGWATRNLKLSNDLIFSSESYLDVRIDSDRFLYERYMEAYQKLLQFLSEDMIRAVFERVYYELYPYFVSREIISQSKYDLKGLTNLDDFQNDLEYHFQYLIVRKRNLEEDIKNHFESQN